MSLTSSQTWFLSASKTILFQTKNVSTSHTFHSKCALLHGIFRKNFQLKISLILCLSTSKNQENLGRILHNYFLVKWWTSLRTFCNRGMGIHSSSWKRGIVLTYVCKPFRDGLSDRESRLEKGDKEVSKVDSLKHRATSGDWFSALINLVRAKI